MTFKQKQDNFVENLTALGDWQERFNYIMELGSDLPEITAQRLTPENLIEGCKSRTYMRVFLDENGKISIQGKSNSPVPVGLIAACAEVFCGLSPAEIAGEEIFFQTQSELLQHLSITRQNALCKMIKRIQLLSQNI
ncbi:MAG: SufE family protein [Prevotellaceae bacterium]|jgi:cysteine desulfuration protein SufE|nr:SufE family protein [Prevotellaceae bacterium]